MRTLVTNDDGIGSPGLAVLAAAAVRAGLDVVVAAPARQSSGASAGIIATTREGRPLIERRQLPDLPDVEAYAVQVSRVTSCVRRSAVGWTRYHSWWCPGSITARMWDGQSCILARWARR
jgi:5'/3'-nucleotidase SurE